VAPTSDEKAVNKSAEAHTVVHKRARDLPKVQAVRMEGQGCNAGGSKPETKPRHLEVVDGQLGQVNCDRSVHDLLLDEQATYRP
jgi:hypothetical protein